MLVVDKTAFYENVIAAEEMLRAAEKFLQRAKDRIPSGTKHDSYLRELTKTTETIVANGREKIMFLTSACWD